MTRVTTSPGQRARWRGPAAKNCQQCGASFKPERIGAKFCSRPCHFAAQVMERKPCERCGQPLRDRKKSQTRFCSRSCAYAALTTRVPPTCQICNAPVYWGSTTCKRHNHWPAKIRRARPCVECGVSFSPPPSAIARSAAKFCSVSCYRAAARRRPMFLEFTCPICGSAFRRTRAAAARLKGAPICSRRCLAVQVGGPGSPSYRGGNLTSYRGPNWIKIRTAIRERDGFRCRRCGKTEQENKRALPVDHVIPWRTFTSADEANRPENLVALCDTCHGRKARAEIRYLRGDVLDMWSFQVAVAQPWTKG
jgi:5-methylcytosine-specific restriction endonuclease McrA